MPKLPAKRGYRRHRMTRCERTAQDLLPETCCQPNIRPRVSFAQVGRPCHLSWAILVRKPVEAVDGVEGLAQVVGDRVGSGDDLPSGSDLDGAVSAGCLDEFPG
jgi:hypothetical protein